MLVKKRWLFSLLAVLVLCSFQLVSFSRAQGETTAIQAVAWSPDGSQIAMGGFDNSDSILTIRNSADMSLVLDLSLVPDGQTRQILSMSWSPDGKYLASGSVDGTIAVWAINDPLRTSGEIIAKFGNFETSIWDVAWSPDGKWIASLAALEQISIWNATNDDYYLMDSLSIEAAGNLSWSPTSIWLAISTDTGAFIYSMTATGTFVATDPYILSLDPNYPPASGVSWNANGSQIAVANRLVNKIYIFDWPQNSLNRILKLANPPGRLAWSPDGTKFAFENGINSVRIVDATTGNDLSNYTTGRSTPIENVVWNPDSSKLAFSSAGDTAQVVISPDSETQTPAPTASAES